MFGRFQSQKERKEKGAIEDEERLEKGYFELATLKNIRNDE